MKILKNDPIGKDLFESHSHDAIAVAISDIIDDVHMIGIDGPWGAGKSNLVGILQKNLEKDNKYSFFIYDAWGHQTDYQRRAIIEEMIGYIHDKELIRKNDSEWQGLCNDILGKVTETNTEIQDGFSWSAFFILCSIVFTPTVMSLASGFDNISVKMSFSSIPFVFVLISVGLAAWKANKGSKEFSQKITIFKDALIGAYKRESIQKKKREFINTHNPSTISFRRFFKKVDASFSQDDTLIIIIDNLDRLSRESVQEIWSSIQACFNDSIEELKHIRVIVPFDRKHLKICHEDVEDSSYINDYIDKTFDIVFRVPLPVMTDWKTYFDSRWEKAFCKTEKQQDTKELDYVKNIYDALTLNITPRNINAFINEMITLSLSQICRDIKYRYRAIFCCRKEQILSDPIKALTDLDYLGPLKSQFVNDDGFYDAISALIYQVPLQRGSEVAIYRTLKHALDFGDSERVVNLSDIPSFPSVLDKIIREYTTPKKLYQPICALQNLVPDNCGGKEIYENRWDLIFDSFQDDDIAIDIGEDKSSNNDSYLFPYQEVMLHHGTDNQKIWLAKIIIARCQKIKDLDPIIYSNTVDKMKNVMDCSCYNIMENLPDIKIPWDLLRQAMEKNSAIMQEYNLSADNDEIMKYLQSLPSTEYKKINYLRTLMQLGYDFSRFHKQLHDTLDRSTDYNTFKEYIYVYEDTTQETKPIKLNYGINYLNEYLQSAENQKDEKLIDRIICFAISKHSLNECNQYNSIRMYLTDHKEDLPNRLFNIIKYYSDYGTFLLHSKDFKENEVYLTLCKKLTEANEVFYCEDISLVIKNFSKIVEDAHLDVGTLADKLSNYEIQAINTKEIKNIINISFLESTQDIDDRLTQDMRERVRSYLDNLSYEEWENIAHSGINSYEFEAMKLVNFERNQSFYLGINNYLADLSEKGEVPSEESKWRSFIDSMEDNESELSALLANVYDKIKDREIRASEFSFWGRWLLKSDKFIITQNTLRRTLTDKVISNKDCMEIILRDDITIRNTIKKIYMAAPTDEKDHFKTILGAVIAKGNEDAKLLAEKMKISYEKNNI